MRVMHVNLYVLLCYVILNSNLRLLSFKFRSLVNGIPGPKEKTNHFLKIHTFGETRGIMKIIDTISAKREYINKSSAGLSDKYGKS